MAIEPLDAICRDGDPESLGPAPTVADGTAVTLVLPLGLLEGGGPPHAATVIRAAQPRSAIRLIA
jgi:hypothetical protein